MFDDFRVYSVSFYTDSLRSGIRASGCSEAVLCQYALLPSQRYALVWHRLPRFSCNGRFFLGARRCGQRREECNDAGRGDRVEAQVLNIGIGLVGRLFGLGPVSLDLLSEALCVLLGALLRLLALEAQILLECRGVPAGVGRDSLVVPVGLDSRLEVLAVGRAGVRNAMVTEPALKLRLVPLVVD